MFSNNNERTREIGRDPGSNPGGAIFGFEHSEEISAKSSETTRRRYCSGNPGGAIFGFEYLEGLQHSKNLHLGDNYYGNKKICWKKVCCYY